MFKSCNLVGGCSIELIVTVSAVYTPAPGEDPEKLGPNEFTAGSALTLDCTVKGHSGALTYTWSVTGNPETPDCNIDSANTPTLALGHPALNSYFAGVYTVRVADQTVGTVMTTL